MQRPLSHRKIGQTDLINERDVSKTDPRIRANGALDEASASIGLARSFLQDVEQKALLLQAQKDLSAMMGFVAGLSPEADSGVENAGHIAVLARWENEIRRLDAQTRYPQRFVYAGETPVGGALDLARTVVRRAERELLGLYETFRMEGDACLQILNRLSTLLYLLLLANDGDLL